MPLKKCGLGLDCASMMMMPGIDPGDCLNYKACGEATRPTPEEEIELIRIRELERQEREEREEKERRIKERIRLNLHQVAVMMLMQRAAPQSPESLGIIESISQLENKLYEVRSRLVNFENYYIAPEFCELHKYSVKRPYGVYTYNKLAADNSIFEPLQKQEKIKSLHLSHDDDPRKIEAQLGIDRRNKLTQARTLLNAASRLINEAISTIQEVEPDHAAIVPEVVDSEEV